MTSYQKKVFTHLADLAKERSITYSVLSGYDPINNMFGRDLDVYVPSVDNAIRLISAFKQVLESNNVRWQFQPDPIWGQRYIGINSQYEYSELHIFSNVRVGPLVVSSHFPTTILHAKNGLLFDPLFVFTKKVLTKHNRRIFLGRPLWLREPPPSFLLEYSQNIDSRTFSGLTQTMLGSDTDEAIENRRRLLARMFSKSSSHPFQSITEICKGIWDKNMGWKYHPCTPIFFFKKPVSTPEKFKKIESILQTNLSSIFPKIKVTDSILPIGVAKKMQARQQLLVYIGVTPSPSMEYIELPQLIQETPKQLCERILDGTVSFNQ